MNSNINILVIDDDPDIGSMMKMMLEFKGYAVTLVSRVDKIPELLSAGSYQLLILDMLIAGENGNDLCRTLKGDERFSAIPILMFSAMPNGGEAALESGANDFIAKPFDMYAMLGKISALTGKVV